MDPLDIFSRLLLSKCPGPQSTSPEVIAQEWIAHGGLSALPSLSEIHGQLERYGLSLQKAETPGLRAHRFCYRGGDPTIFYEIILDRLEAISAGHEMTTSLLMSFPHPS